MADTIIIIKDDGTSTGAMSEGRAYNYLLNLIAGQQRDSNLSQALSDVIKGDAKATGAYVFRNLPVRHASAGKVGVSSVTLFFIISGGFKHIFAMGRHSGTSGGKTVYDISDYGQPDAPYKKGSRIAI